MLLETLESVADALYTFGCRWRVRSFEQVQALLDRGADKVVLKAPLLGSRR